MRGTLNQVEIEFSILSRQCLDRRISVRAACPEGTLARSWRREISAWQKQRNSLAASVNWRFKTTDARRKMERLYPNA
jgi:hypothetical protein